MTDAACDISGQVILFFQGVGGGGVVTEVKIFICLHHFLYVQHMSINFCSVLIIVIPVLCCYYCQECFVCKLVKREGGGGCNTSGVCLVFDTALWS